MATKSTKPSPAKVTKTPAKAESPSYTKVIRDLAKILDETKLTEIEFEKSGIGRVRVSRQGTAVAPVAAAPAPAPVATTPTASAETAAPQPAPQESGEIVKSPMVGVAYMAPAPGEKNFIAVGAKVKEGDTLLIVEAMKVMNPIRSPHSGVVKAILVNNEEPVEFDQPLVSIG